MDEYLFNRILKRVLMVPLVALLLLTLLLGIGLRGYRVSSRAIDHSDQVFSHGNRLGALMADEETGSRGFLVTRQERFLEPLTAARSTIGAEFSRIDTLVADNPSQIAQIDQIRKTYTEFTRITDRMIAQARADQDVIALTSRQKELMDINRKQLAEFENAEGQLREGRVRIARLLHWWTSPLLILATAIAALLITRFTWRSFREVKRAFAAQVMETRAQRDDIYEREQWLQTTLRSIGDGVIMCDSEGRIDFMNPVAEELTGWPEDEARGKPLPQVFRILNEYTREVVESPVDKVRRQGTIVGLANHTVLVDKNDNERSIDDSGAPVRNQAGQLIGIVMVFRDNHDKRLAEHSLIQAEKLAAAGRMAATVAHEVNNPLEAIVNLMYLGLREQDTAEVHRLMRLAESEVHRIAHLTRQSLGFYHEPVALAEFRPAEVVEEVVAFYGGQANRLNIEIQTMLEAEASILGARGELRQVLSNLIANSIDALGGDGRIVVAVRDTREAGTGSLKGVRIAIADTGKGIPPNLKHKVFEPFFTTKADVGTGLGLWVSRELVEKHGGKLSMRSRPGVGTLFLISLPVPNQLSQHQHARANGQHNGMST